MALVIKDRVQETTITTGTGDITLAGAVSGFKSFGSVMANGDTTYYAIIGSTVSTEWEIGLGTYTTAGTLLTRTTVLANSLGTTALINFSAGTKFVFQDAPADRVQIAPAASFFNTVAITVDLGTTPVFSYNYNVTISAALWAATNTINAHTLGDDFVLIASGVTAYGDEYEMDGIDVSAKKGAASPNITLYITSSSGGPIAGQRTIGLQLSS
jgi:hypothetical protein